MLNAIYIIIFLCLSLPGMGQSDLDVSKNAGVLISNDLVYNFGEITPWEIVEHKFQYKNYSKMPWRILKIDASCGCTNAQISRTTVSPNESVEISFSFNPAGLEGEIQRKIILTIDAPERSTIIFEFKAKVVVPIQMYPSKVEFKNLSLYETPTKTIKVVYAEKYYSNLRLEIISTDPDSSKYLTIAIENGKNNGIITLTIIPSRIDINSMIERKGGIVIWVRAISSVESFKIPLYVEWDLSPVVASTVHSLAWVGKTDLSPTKEFFVFHVDDRPLKIEKLKSDTSSMSVDSIRVSPSKYKILVKINENLFKDNGLRLKREIEIMTNEPLQPILRISVLVLN